MKVLNLERLKMYPGPKFAEMIAASKTYGICYLNKKAYYRNYKRILKNGKGLSSLEVILKVEYINFPNDFKPLFKDFSNDSHGV